MSKTKIRLYADIVLLIAFIIVSAPQTTGIAWHEWVSFLFIPWIILHLILDWAWIVSVTKRVFKHMPGETRFNHFWDTLLFVMMVLVIVSGVVISEAALPAMGITVVIDPFWSQIHNLSANLLLLMVGIHLAMHLKWIVNAFKRYLLKKNKSTKKTAIASGD